MKAWLNRQRGHMAKVGLKGNTPVVGVEPGAEGKRALEFYVNDVKSTLGRLDVQIAKCVKLNMKLTFGLEVVDGVQRVVLISAVLP
jgi:hypothetical protein